MWNALPAGQVCAFLAISLDGFIAGERGELDWLPSLPEGEDGGFAAFFGTVGCLLMGRNTFDVVTGMATPWPYGATPVHVATRRPLENAPPSVKAVEGAISHLLAEAKLTARGQHVYLDGGQLFRQAWELDAIDVLTLTWVPTVLGRGIPLWSGIERRHSLNRLKVSELPSGLLQVTYARKMSTP